jgi:hypothetical protein
MAKVGIIGEAQDDNNWRNQQSDKQTNQLKEKDHLIEQSARRKTNN